MCRLASIVLLATSACASSEVRVAPCRGVAMGLSLEEARAIVEKFDERQAAHSLTDPLRKPGSLDDVTEILKRDQIDLFPAGVAFLERDASPDALALRAQIELAWGDDQLTLSHLFADLSARMQELVRSLELEDARDDDANRRLEKLRAQLALSHGVAEALDRLSAEHSAQGARLARTVIASNPDDYRGYRVAADYHRMREDWRRFDDATRKIEALRPDSNGLLFLKGASLLARDGNAVEAARLLEQALAKDPKFLRARAVLVMSEPSIAAKHENLAKLREANPNHQIVVWAGPSIDAAYDAVVARERALAQ